MTLLVCAMGPMYIHYMEEEEEGGQKRRRETTIKDILC